MPSAIAAMKVGDSRMQIAACTCSRSAVDVSLGKSQPIQVTKCKIVIHSTYSLPFVTKLLHLHSWLKFVLPDGVIN